MGEINILAVFLGAVAFFVIGALWYGPLFGKAWKDLVGYDGEKMPHPVSNNPVPVVMGVAFLFELLIAVMLAHLIARTTTSPHVIMMMAVGFGATIMAPALGINYMFQQRPGKLFAIDAGYFIVGMAAMGGVFVLFS
ncbi:DUF1761 family protein [Altererythrobacter salegens]|uniref:DUF1761 family protein n=1 Tax=Croceibacterium salegens TaxID=1737568 RepID=A0A6I4SYI2_9SPHN|nr:DUF1761 domain-containing protein [Croceibacterium salegens]MXO60893.1 DUF1761 family protein [Croceibacterium salegens]